MRGRIALAAAAWSVLAGPAGLPPAGADTLSSVLGEPLVETLHTVDIELNDTVAVYTVRRTLHNDGEEGDEAQLDIGLPPGGALTGLRLKTGGTWIDGKLLDQEQASERYVELTQPGEAKPRAVALLAWEGRGSGSLKVFPIAAGKTVTVEYTIVAPVRVQAGRIWLAVPRTEGEGTVRPDVRVDGASDLREVSATYLPAFDADDFDAYASYEWTWYSATVAALTPAVGEVRTSFAAVALEGTRWIWRFELDAPAAWGTRPVGARVVFVLDASHSEGRAGIDGQLSLVRGYLSHLPDATAEIILFRRRAARLFGEFVPAGELGAMLDEVVPTAFLPGNGSHLDEGLALAASALAGWEGPARIVFMTDEYLRGSFDPDVAAKALAAVPPGTIVHGVLRIAGRGGPLSEGWHEDSPLLPVVRTWGGTVVAIEGDQTDPADLARVTRGLVVPIRIDGMVILSEPLSEAAAAAAHAAEEEGDPDGEVNPQLGVNVAWPVELREGESVRRMELVDERRPWRPQVRGWLWGKEWVRDVPVSAPLTRAVPALAFGHPLEENLQDAEGRALATKAGAVSRWTSYLAEQKNAAPSTDGYEIGTIGCIGGVGSGSFSCGTRCGIGCGGALDLSKFIAILRARTEPAIAECARRAGQAELDVVVRVETTFHEIVDVGVTGDLAPPLLRCVEDAVWAAQLDARFRWESRSFDVRVVIGDGDDAPAEPVDRKEWFL